ncbi:MAG: helix-turn-helix domain-containing protein [Leptospirillum sp.]|jgi:DNA-binding CsgD family transcriptional regulator
MKELSLSKRQSEVIPEIMRGRTNKEISLKFGITLQTVKDHLYTIFQQLKVRNCIELIIHVVGDLVFQGMSDVFAWPPDGFFGNEEFPDQFVEGRFLFKSLGKNMDGKRNRFVEKIGQGQKALF